MASIANTCQPDNNLQTMSFNDHTLMTIERNGWLSRIEIERVKPKRTLIRYKEDCHKALHEYRHKENVINYSTYSGTPFTITESNGLIRAIQMTAKLLNLSYDEAINLVRYRFNINHIDELALYQVGEAIEYTKRIALGVITSSRSHHISYERQQEAMLFGQVTSTRKFFGAVDKKKRNVLYEMNLDEFITDSDELDSVIINSTTITTHQLAKIAYAASSQLVFNSGKYEDGQPPKTTTYHKQA